MGPKIVDGLSTNDFVVGNPPACSTWVGQCALYILVMILEKILMTLLIQFDFWKQVNYYLYMYFVSYTVESFSFMGPMFYTFVGLLGRNFVGTCGPFHKNSYDRFWS